MSKNIQDKLNSLRKTQMDKLKEFERDCIKEHHNRNNNEGLNQSPLEEIFKPYIPE